MPGPDKITLRRPDDWHLHVRDGSMMAAVVPFTARRFARAIIMPNLVPPVTTIEQAIAYRERILRTVPQEEDFNPLMTCYLTDTADADEIARGHAEGVFAAVKLYPAGATTNTDAGVTDLSRVSGALERMQEIGMPLLVHGEATDPEVDVYDREAVFIDRVLLPLMVDFPALKVVFEHVTTEQAVQFVSESSERLAATVTPHHLFINRNAMFESGIRPHMYCLPVAKRERHRLALRRAVTSGDARFFLGTDSAPHAASAKESACGCAGIFSAPSALELYAQAFNEEGAIDKLEAFASFNGPAFYGLPVNEETITLNREVTSRPLKVTTTEGDIVKPFFVNDSLQWRMQGD